MPRKKTINYWTSRIYIPKIQGKPTVDKNWFVEFYYRDPDTNKMIRKRFYGDINDLTSVTARKKRARDWAKLIDKNLKNETLPSFVGYSKKVNVGLEQAIRQKAKYVTPENIKQYEMVYRNLMTYFKLVSLDQVNLDYIQRKHILNWLKWIQAKKTDVKVSTINTYLRYTKAIFQHLVENDVIKHNPASNVKRLPQKITTSNEPLSKSEQRTISEYLEEHDPRFYTFIAFMYHSGLRPKQILRLQVKDIDLEQCVIKASGDTNKIGLQQVKAIPEHFTERIRNHLQGSEPNVYVFGSRPHLNPSDKPALRDSVTKKWQRIVKRKLGINKSMYSIRHKSAADMYYDGIDIKTISIFLGHRSIVTTEKYLRSIVDFSLEKLKQRERKF